ncbi:MAG: exosortase B [Thiomicrorhabdus sp.]|nr:exosortase B [Thiomicrorhabdus sp.]
MNSSIESQLSKRLPHQWQWTPIVLGILILFIPTYMDLASTIWATDEQGHGPIILMISLFLFWQKRDVFISGEYQQSQTVLGGVLLAFSLLVYVVGRSQGILIFEVGSQVLILSSIILLTLGTSALKKLWFPLFFLIFMLPLPGALVDALTLPMKIAVSNVAEMILYNLDYPIARSGVILQIGYYKLLVADACAGLHTVFTLEAMGLLYLHLIKRDSFARNVSLAILILPISFFANTVRVMILVLVTYHYGDEVGQGFIHDFAGLVLFGVALVLIIFVDTTIHWFERRYKARKSAKEQRGS